MASKKTKRKTTKRCPPCTAASMARAEFSSAIRGGHCSVASRELDKIKSEISKKVDNMGKGARALAYRDLLHKQDAVNRCSERRETSDASRFNGLRPRRRRAR